MNSSLTYSSPEANFKRALYTRFGVNSQFFS
jgi:hypothetical protein